MSVRTNRKKKINSHVNFFFSTSTLLKRNFPLVFTISFTQLPFFPWREKRQGRKKIYIYIYIYKSPFSFIIKRYHSSRALCFWLLGVNVHDFIKGMWNSAVQFHAQGSPRDFFFFFFWISSFELEVSGRTFPGDGQVKAHHRMNTP